MLVFGTEMHVVTFLFAALETILFFFQLVFYLIRPQDKYRLWYLTLLTLLLLYNIASGLFPDTNIPIPIYIQNIIAYGAGFCTASFFPFYFYKAFNLRRLKFHALYGIWLFLILPYVIFFVVVYSINKDLESARRFGLIIPFFYSLTLIWAITKAIFPNYKESKYTRSVSEIIGVYLAVAPWTALTVVVYLDAGQPVEASLTNGGFLVITILYIAQTIRKYRYEYRELQNYNVNFSRKLEEVIEDQKTAILVDAFKTIKTFESLQLKSHEVTISQKIEGAAKRFNLTPREKDIVKLISEGYKYSEIAKTLYIADRTVTTHVDNIFKKVAVTNKIELIKKLELLPPTL
jgi:Response regulator containing a CheY-like receiver domain and an HTH DNA-binding domain